MNKFRSKAAVTAATILSATCANATLYDLALSVDGGQLGAQTVDVTLDMTPGVFQPETSTGITVNAGTTITPEGGYEVVQWICTPQLSKIGLTEESKQ